MDRCAGAVFLVHRTVGEELLVGGARLRAHGEQKHPGREPVQPVHRADRRVVEFSAQPDQRGLHHMRSPRHRRQIVRFVHDHQIVVLMDDRQVERYLRLHGQVAVEVDRPSDLGRCSQIDGFTTDAEHLPALGPDQQIVERQALTRRCGQHRLADRAISGTQNDPSGVHTVAQWERRRFAVSHSGRLLDVVLGAIRLRRVRRAT